MPGIWFLGGAFDLSFLRRYFSLFFRQNIWQVLPLSAVGAPIALVGTGIITGGRVCGGTEKGHFASVDL